MNMRSLMMLVESTAARSEEFIKTAETAISHLAVDVSLIPTESGTVILDSIDAHQPGQGSGSKALALICAFADQYGITLTLEVDDEAGESTDGDYDGDDEDEPAEQGLMNSDQLMGWYGAAGFEVTGHTGWRMAMTRIPAPVQGT